MESRCATRPRFALLWTGALLSLACSIRADYTDTRYRCAESQLCPDGYACVRGLCLAGVVDPGPCGSMAVAGHDFTDIDFADFDSTSIWDYSVDSTASITAEAGQLIMEAPDAAEDLGSNFKLDKIFPRSRSVASIEIVERSSDGTSAAYLIIEDREGDHVEFYLEAGQLYAVLHTSADELILNQFAFEPDIHRFWRIHEQDGLFVFTTSPDGSTWTEQATSAGENVDGWLGAEFGIWKLATGGGPARLVVDHFNGGSSAESFCPSLAFQDDFDDGIQSADWQLRDSNQCTVVEQDGRLSFAFPNSGESECTYRSNTRFDLRASTISVEAPLLDVPDLEQCLKLQLSDGQDIEFELRGGALRGEKTLINDEGVLFEVPFDAVAHRYWRFRGEGDTVFWELSADGREWQIMSSQQSLDWDLSAVTIDLVGDTNNGEVGNPGMGFDNLSITP